MKKIFSLLLLVAATFGLASCDRETNVSAGGTAVQNLAGIWDVQVDVIEIGEDGTETHYGDYYGYGTFQIYTYNTVENDKDSLWVDDLGNFWDVLAKVGCNTSDRTFSAKDAVNVNEDKTVEKCRVEGKVLPGAAINLHGKPNDSICVDFEFDTDPGMVYRYAGQRYTGFYE